MKHLYIKRRDDGRIICEVDAPEKDCSRLIRGMMQAIKSEYPDWDAFYYIDDSEFGSAKIGIGWFRWLVAGIAALALALIILGSLSCRCKEAYQSKEERILIGLRIVIDDPCVYQRYFNK